MNSILRKATPRQIPTIANQFRTITTSNIKMQNDRGQGVSHAKDSQLPQGAQEKVHSSPLGFFKLRHFSFNQPHHRSPAASSTKPQTHSTTPTPTRTLARSRTLRATRRFPRPYRRDFPRRSRRLCQMLFTTPAVQSSRTAVYRSNVVTKDCSHQEN